MPIAVAQSPSKLAVALPAILADRGNVSARDMRRHPIGTGRSNSSSTNPTNRSRWRGTWITGSRSGPIWRLALAMTDGRRRACADHDSRPRAFQRKCAEDPERRLVSVGDRSRRFRDHDHLAHGAPTGAVAACERDRAARSLATCEEVPEARVSGTAVFLTTQTERVPTTLLRNLKHNKVLHQTVLLVRVVTENIPRVAGPERIKARDLGSGFWQIEAHFGFAQTPNVPRELGRADIPGLKLDPSQLSFFIGRANVKSSPRPGMARWREHLYSGLARIATRSTDSSASRRTGSSNSAPRSRYDSENSAVW
jgi:hypothetical protein